VDKGLVMTGITFSPENDNPASDENTPEGPSTRQYHAGVTFRYTYHFYNLTRDAEKRSAVEVATNLYHLGRPLSVGAPREVAFNGTGDVDRRSVSGVVRIPKELAPGRYVLKVSEWLLAAESGSNARWISGRCGRVMLPRAT
jgi:hypothetical protein